MRVLRWVAVAAVAALLAVGIGLGARRWRVALLPESAYLRPDQPSAPPSHVVLPESALADFKEFYFGADKPGPPPSFWFPSQQQIEELEHHLPLISKLRPPHWDRLPTIEDPASYNIQYLGVEVNGTRQIFVNASCEFFDMSAARWNSHLFMVYDGFTCFWHVFYNPVTRSFSNFEINGRA
jgi:hypothetical protein